MSQATGEDVGSSLRCAMITTFARYTMTETSKMVGWHRVDDNTMKCYSCGVEVPATLAAAMGHLTRYNQNDSECEQRQKESRNEPR